MHQTPAPRTVLSVPNMTHPQIWMFSIIWITPGGWFMNGYRCYSQTHPHFRQLSVQRCTTFMIISKLNLYLRCSHYGCHHKSIQIHINPYTSILISTYITYIIYIYIIYNYIYIYTYYYIHYIYNMFEQNNFRRNPSLYIAPNFRPLG